MLALMLENQADSPFANLRRITCRMSSHNSSPFSQDGASGKAGAVQLQLNQAMARWDHEHPQFATAREPQAGDVVTFDKGEAAP